jgi:hypothetical protein
MSSRSIPSPLRSSDSIITPPRARFNVTKSPFESAYESLVPRAKRLM